MSGFGEKLGRKKEAAVLALLSSRNVEEAARAAGVTARTLYRWQKEPEFDAAYREARRAAVSQANARLQQASGAAATTILKLMVDSTVPASVRIRASECVLNHANKTIEIEDIEVRVAALEEAAKKAAPKTRKTISSRRLGKTEATLAPKPATENEWCLGETTGCLASASCRIARRASIKSSRAGRTMRSGDGLGNPAVVD
jgi:transposase-like protein